MLNPPGNGGFAQAVGYEPLHIRQRVLLIDRIQWPGTKHLSELGNTDFQSCNGGRFRS
ncbi:MAG TPA: hypothetical protein PLQ00_12230 [Thermoguttaceae bacterium]|nr:hypothetical protein [Thermoguttaceae bacterium]